MKRRNKSNLMIIGRKEIVSFPMLDLIDLEAKIDTGAYTSALHCKDIELKKINEITHLCFKLLDDSHPEYKDKEFRFTQFGKKL